MTIAVNGNVKNQTKQLKSKYDYDDHEYDQEISQSYVGTNPGQHLQNHRTHTVTRYQKDNLSRAISSLFSVKMISKLNRTLCNA